LAVLQIETHKIRRQTSRIAIEWLPASAWAKASLFRQGLGARAFLIL
jgi:hypothetical protein